jgi:predicted nucleic acid-binding Zn finger protein
MEKQPSQRAIDGLTIVVSNQLQCRVTTKSGEAALIPAGSAQGAFYVVTPEFCTCPDHSIRKVVCKHIIAVRIAAVMAAADETNDEVLRP